jgi:poly(glycerol-phosphate) alpha-glucosyltransferase
MKIYHFTLGKVNPDSSNGINKVIEGLAKYGNKIENININVVTLKKNLKEKEKKYERDGFEVTAFNSMKSVISFFKKNKNDIDFVHLHNVWSIQNIILYRYLVKFSIPYMVTPHAGLLEDRVRKSNFFKKIFFHYFFQKKFLDKSIAIHAVSREEMTSIAAYTSNQNIFSIPNGIDITQKVLPKSSKYNNKITIGYLGRLSEEKNIVALIYALEKLPPDILDYIEVIIMGKYNTNYGKKCINLVQALRLNNYVHFTGKVSKEQKWQKLANLDIYIQPSLSEGASLAVLEAMYSRLPIIATRTCNISYLHGQFFLKMVEPIPNDIARGLKEVINNVDQYVKAGDVAYNYVRENHDWSDIAKTMISTYQNQLNQHEN